MRILFLSNFYPPHDLGGFEKHCQEVADSLRNRGHNVHILTSLHGVTAPVEEGYIRRALKLESDLDHYDPIRFFLGRTRESRYNARIVQAAIAEINPSVIMVWGMWNLSLCIPATAERSELPVAYWLEDLWPVEPDIHTKYWQSKGHSVLGKLFLAGGSRLAAWKLAAEHYPPRLKYDHVACGSRFIQRTLAAQIPAFCDARVLLCGIDLNPYASHVPRVHLQDMMAPRLLFVGRLAPQKGVHTTISAMAHLTQRYPNLHPILTIVGSGHQDYTTQLRTLASQSGCEKLIDFVAAVPTEEVPSLLAKHDMLLVPSVWEEPFGRVVVEGMAAGLPVIGTATGGSGEILIDGLNGLTFPVEDAGALAHCIMRLVQNPDLYAFLTYAGKETAMRFDLSRMVDGIECYLHEVVAAHEAKGAIC